MFQELSGLKGLGLNNSNLKQDENKEKKADFPPPITSLFSFDLPSLAGYGTKKEPPAP